MPSLEIAGLAIGLREGVLALIVLIALYIAFVLWRMRRLVSAPGPDQGVSQSSIPGSPTANPDAHPASKSEPAETMTAQEAMSRDVTEPSGGRIDGEMMSEGLARELSQLRDEVDVMRGELAALREDMLHEMAHLRAAQTVSPIYGDAVQMAAAGYDAAAIAERCGIARAEAELVVALARSQLE